MPNSMRGSTYYLGDGKYAVTIILPKTEFTLISELREKILSIKQAVHRNDSEYYWDDDDGDAIDAVLDYVEVSDTRVIFKIICDRLTYKQLQKNKGYYGYVIEK